MLQSSSTLRTSAFASLSCHSFVAVVFFLAVFWDHFSLPRTEGLS